MMEIIFREFHRSGFRINYPQEKELRISEGCESFHALFKNYICKVYCGKFVHS